MMTILWRVFNNLSFIKKHKLFFNLPSIINLIKFLTLPRKRIVQYKPLQISCYVTDKCTLNCNFCPHHSLYRNKNYPFLHNPLQDMSFETFKKIIDTFPETIRVTLAGVGEPFLNKDIFKMMDYAISNGKLITVISNGTLLKDNLDELLKRRIFSLCISLNVDNQIEYYKLTNNEKYDFNSIVSALQEFSKKNKKKIKLYLTYVVSKENVLNIDKILNFVREKLPDVSTVKFFNVIYFGIEQEYPLEETLRDDDLEVVNYLEQLKKQTKNYPFQIVLPQLKNTIKGITCDDFFTHLLIDAEGNVSSCGRSITPQKEFGNIFKEGRDVWNNDFFQKMRVMSIKKEFNQHPVCKNCMGS
ncbi:MAG: radical SAM protein [Candidatus Scalindua sp.]